MNQACTEVKYKMPEQEEVMEEEDSDDGEGTFEKVEEIWNELGRRDGYECSKKNKKKPEMYEMHKMDKLFKYFSGVNKKGQKIEMTSPDISKMKREKVSFTFDNASSGDQNHTKNVIIS